MMQVFTRRLALPVHRAEIFERRLPGPRAHQSAEAALEQAREGAIDTPPALRDAVPPCGEAGHAPAVDVTHVAEAAEALEQPHADIEQAAGDMALTDLGSAFGD